VMVVFTHLHLTHIKTLMAREILMFNKVLNIITFIKHGIMFTSVMVDNQEEPLRMSFFQMVSNKS
jgi:hypothetical protein